MSLDWFTSPDRTSSPKWNKWAISELELSCKHNSWPRCTGPGKFFLMIYYWQKYCLLDLIMDLSPQYLQKSCVSEFETVEKNLFSRLYKLVNCKALCLLEKQRIISVYGTTLSVITIRKAGKKCTTTVLTLDYTFAFSRSSWIFCIVVPDCVDCFGS